MDSQSAPVVSAAKLPILNPNEFDLWKMRIEQYFLMTDYSLWKVIINGNSVISRVTIDGVAQPVTVLTAKQKLARKNELKARGTLLMALPEKHQLKFNSHKDAKTLMEAIEKCFRGNTKTKKVQKILLKQKFENFTGSSSEDLDQIHDRLQKLVSQLEINRVSLSQEDVNLKFLRSLPSEWKTHTLMWRNKANLEEHSLDDLFNGLKIYETEVRHSSSPSNPTQNLAFVSTSNTDSTTDSVSAATSVSAVCAKLPVSSHPNIDSLSNAVIFSFFASQSTNPQLDNKDLKQIDVDDLEEMDLRWQMAMLTMRARIFLQKTGKIWVIIELQLWVLICPKWSVITATERDISPGSADLLRTQEGQSYQAKEEPANFALMAIPSSRSSDNEVQSCSTACSKAYKQLHSQYDSQTVEFHKSRLDVISYQAALESVESRLIVYKENESIFQENIIVLKIRLSPMGGYHAVPPPITKNFMPPKPDLVFNIAPLAVESDHLAFNIQVSPPKHTQAMSHTTESMAPIIEDWVSDSEDESEPNDPQSVSI
nr:hypothetical protein [Tanacetum cinerariifolium]